MIISAMSYTGDSQSWLYLKSNTYQVSKLSEG